VKSFAKACVGFWLALSSPAVVGAGMPTDPVGVGSPGGWAPALRAQISYRARPKPRARAPLTASIFQNLQRSEGTAATGKTPLSSGLHGKRSSQSKSHVKSVGGADPVDNRLNLLAARAAKRNGWRSLRKFAASAKDPERRGLAYLVLGFRESEAADYPDAMAHLILAEEAEFSLADFARYLRAADEDKAGQSDLAIKNLETFPAQSILHHQALELLAQMSLRVAQPQRAIAALTAGPDISKHPDLVLLLAQAYQQAERLEDAARAFQQVDYAFPLSSEAKTASAALRRLEVQLGVKLPSVSDETRTGRAEALFHAGLSRLAFEEYDALLKTLPNSAFAPRWKIGRARCLLRLRRSPEAAETLEFLSVTNPQLDAARLETLVDADARRDDAAAMLRELDQLRQLYSQSPAYAAALFVAGGFYWRQGARADAARYYQSVAELFPESDSGREGHWRLSWSHYLDGARDQARRDFLNHIARYPNSTHIPAALYWLGRLAEGENAISEARAAYHLVITRYGRAYYALLAGTRITALARERGAANELAGPPPAPPDLAAVAGQIPRLEPAPVSFCTKDQSDGLLRPYSVLKSVSLESLAGDYLDAALTEHPGSPELLFAFAKFKAEQDEPGSALLTGKKLLPNYAQYDFPALPAEVWNLLYPQGYLALVKGQARVNGLDPQLVMAVIRGESGFDPLATSSANALGLMQIMPDTAGHGRGGRASIDRRLYMPEYNVRFGTRYLRSLVDKYNGSIEPALAAYNAGNTNVQAWMTKFAFRDPAEFVESIPFTETRGYVEAVVRDAEIYRQLMTGTAKFKKCS
jgi:soluble lytic murein transglycosylase